MKTPTARRTLSISLTALMLVGGLSACKRKKKQAEANEAQAEEESANPEGG